MPCATRSRAAGVPSTGAVKTSVVAGVLRPSACNRSRASVLAAADKGASSLSAPGTIQSGTSALADGAGVVRSLQQAAQSALMKRSNNATGRGVAAAAGLRRQLRAVQCQQGSQGESRVSHG